MKKKLLLALALVLVALSALYIVYEGTRPAPGTTKLPTEAYLEGSGFAGIAELTQYLREPLAAQLPFQGQEIQVTNGITLLTHRGEPGELVLQSPVALLFQRGIWGDYFARADGFDIADTLAAARTLLVFPPMGRSPGGNYVPQCLFYDMETGECFHAYSVSYAKKERALPALLEGCTKVPLSARREESSSYGILALRQRLGLEDGFSGLLQLAEGIQPENIVAVPSHAGLSELGYRLEDLCVLVLAVDEEYQGNTWHPPTLFDALRAGHFSVITGVPLARSGQRLAVFCSLAALFHEGDYTMSDTGAYRATFRYDVLDYDTGAYVQTLYQSLEAPSIISTYTTKAYVFKSPDWWAAVHKLFPEETEE